MKIIKLHQLKCPTTIGTHAFEQSIQQTLLIDVEFSFSIGAVELRDDIADTIDYQVLAENIQQFTAQSSYQLLETLCGQLFNHLQQHYQPHSLSLTITKPLAIADAKGVSVTQSTPSSLPGNASDH